jgi:hypothetical protein
MWPWIRRWRDWAMHDLWTMHRASPQPQALHYSYEKAGLTLHDQPIPWNAEAVLVEATVRFPPAAARRKADFQLRLPRQEPLAPESLRQDEADGRHRLLFRLPTPAQTTTAELLYRNYVLGQLTLPVLSFEEFLRGLRLQMPTLFARLGEHSVACQTFVATQCRGLLVSGLLTSPTSLVPLLDLGLEVCFQSEKGNASHKVKARLSSSQLAGRQALVTVVPRRFPRRIGNWLVTWSAGEQPLAHHHVRAISQRTFQRSLRIADTRFAVRRPKEGMTQTRHLPPLDQIARVGPCFLVASGEQGMAGLCRLQVRAQVPGSIQSPPLMEEEALITDGPTMFAPGTVDVGDLGQLTGFELRHKGGSLGVLSLCPAPTASFTAEGGFKQPQDFSWSAAADEELNDRLGRLFEMRNNGD